MNIIEKNLLKRIRDQEVFILGNSVTKELCYNYDELGIIVGADNCLRGDYR